MASAHAALARHPRVRREVQPRLPEHPDQRAPLPAGGRGAGGLPGRRAHQNELAVRPLPDPRRCGLNHAAEARGAAVLRHRAVLVLPQRAAARGQWVRERGRAATRAREPGDAAAPDSVIRTLDFRLQTPLHLSDAELADLVAFLKSLTDPSARDLSALVPAAVPSGLPVPQ